MAILEVAQLEKSFGGTKVLRDISFSLEEGQALSIIGSSGSGKTTLLRCLNFLETPDSGRIAVRGRNLLDGSLSPQERRRNRLHFGLVFQDFNLFPQYTALENVTLARRLLAKSERTGEAPEAIRREGEALLEQMGLGDRMGHYPHQLSGGQKQRVAIARALAMKPDILCFDEPTSALDPELTGEVLKVIRQLARQRTTMVIVTHEMNFAKAISSQVIYMDEKGIYEMGPPAQIFDAPKRERTKAFINRLKTFQQTITDRKFDIYGLNGAVVEFCRRQFATEKQIYRVQLVLEELLVNIMLPQMKGERIAIDVTVEYSMKDSVLSVFAATDQEFSLEGQGGDDLSLSMLKAVSTDIVREANGVRLFL